MRFGKELNLTNNEPKIQVFSVIIIAKIIVNNSHFKVSHIVIRAKTSSDLMIYLQYIKLARRELIAERNH